MANKRMTDGDMFEDEFFTSLSIFERLLWIGIFTKLADDQGRLRDNAALIRSNIFPLDDIPLEKIESAVQSYSTAGRIVRYEKDGKKLIQIVKWWKHQKPRWASASKYPAPDDWIDRYRYHGEGNIILASNWNSTGGFIGDYIANSIECEDEEESEIKSDVDGESEEEVTRARTTSQIINKLPDPELEGISPFTLDERIEERELVTIYMNVTGNMGLPVKSADRKALIESLRDIHANKNSHTTEYLRPFFKAWCDRSYSKTNIGWLDWAMAGEVKDKKDPAPVREKIGSGNKGMSALERMKQEEMEKYNAIQNRNY